MLRFLPILAIAVATPAAADTLTCVDPAAEITLEIVESYDADHGTFGVVSSRFQITDDMGYATGNEPNNDGDITLINVVTNFDTLAYDFHLLNAEKGYDTIVGSVRLTRAQEGVLYAVGGTIHVGGGGAWAVACSGGVAIQSSFGPP